MFSFDSAGCFNSKIPFPCSLVSCLWIYCSIFFLIHTHSTGLFQRLYMPCLVFSQLRMKCPNRQRESKIQSPSLLLASINLAMSFSGFCVGCSVFSGIEQYGMVISSQKLDKYINYYFLYFKSFWDFYSLYSA